MWASGDVGERSQWRHQARRPRLRANARGCDGFVRKELAKAVGSRTQNLTRVTRVTPDCWGHSLSSAFAKSWRRGRTAGIGGQRLFSD
jgi:hypothetical protein